MSMINLAILKLNPRNKILLWNHSQNMELLKNDSALRKFMSSWPMKLVNQNSR